VQFSKNLLWLYVTPQAFCLRLYTLCCCVLRGSVSGYRLRRFTPRSTARHKLLRPPQLFLLGRGSASGCRLRRFTPRSTARHKLLRFRCRSCCCLCGVALQAVAFSDSRLARSLGITYSAFCRNCFYLCGVASQAVAFDDSRLAHRSA